MEVKQETVESKEALKKLSSKSKNRQKSESTLLVNLISNLTDKFVGFEPQIQETKILEESKLASVIPAELELGEDKFKEIIETLIGFEATVVAAFEEKQADKRSAVENCWKTRNWAETRICVDLISQFNNLTDKFFDVESQIQETKIVERVIL